MKNPPDERLSSWRLRKGIMGSDDSYGATGLFLVPFAKTGRTLRIIASDGSDWPVAELGNQPWEHASVSLPNRCPNWDEMCFVKHLFWDAEECVMQFYPALSEYINDHPYCLHLWKPIGVDFPTPPKLAVGSGRGIADMAKRAYNVLLSHAVRDMKL